MRGFSSLLHKTLQPPITLAGTPKTPFRPCQPLFCSELCPPGNQRLAIQRICGSGGSRLLRSGPEQAGFWCREMWRAQTAWHPGSLRLTRSEERKPNFSAINQSPPSRDSDFWDYRPESIHRPQSPTKLQCGRVRNISFYTSPSQTRPMPEDWQVNRHSLSFYLRTSSALP